MLGYPAAVAPTDPGPDSPSRQVYRLTLRYDGRAYHGWQRHPGKATVQGAVEAAIVAVFGSRCAVHGSGRTDRGAHADAQVAHVQVPLSLPPEQVLSNLNAALASDIRVIACQAAPPTFHARHDAVAKTYRYEIWNAPQCPQARLGRVWHIPGPLNLDAMDDARTVFVGVLDFSSFAKKSDDRPRSMVRTMTAVEFERNDPLLVLRFVADGFLYNMVRNLVRGLVKVGEGRITREQLLTIVHARDRSAAPGTAPASGLHLQHVAYPDD